MSNANPNAQKLSGVYTAAPTPREAKLAHEVAVLVGVLQGVSEGLQSHYPGISAIINRQLVLTFDALKDIAPPTAPDPQP